MQKLFFDTRELDASCRASYGLTEEIMMENAASSLEQAICEFDLDDHEVKNVVILCGSGNNGADGYALARRLRLDCTGTVIQCALPSSPLCKLQASRAEQCGVSVIPVSDDLFDVLEEADVIVDCVFGSGFHGELPEEIQTLNNDINSLSAYRIACDVPTGLDAKGNISKGTFCADLTVTMGALKTGLYSDCAKDVTGLVVCANLGVSRRLFENSSSKVFHKGMLLEETDMKLPFRTRSCVNKGTYGHAVIACGQKSGAALIAGSAAIRFGAGLVTLCGETPSNVPMELMTSKTVPEKCSGFCFGPGLGREENDSKEWFEYAIRNKTIPCVLDADACYSEKLDELLKIRGDKTVLTPHPKEFQSLLKVCGLGDYSVEECVSNRMELIEKFCRKYKGAVLLVKGANPVIGYFDGENCELYVNAFGKPCLAKAGSGDVLSGLITALLAQGYEPLEAAISGSLAHALASQQVECDYSMVPEDLINGVSCLAQ